MLPIKPAADATLTPIAARIAELSIAHWDADRAVRIVGHDPSLLAVQRQLLQFAQADSPVLVTGETGTGKELFARGLYLLSQRIRHPLICVNCAQYQDTQLLASELFGHRRGSFTGAIVDRPGVFEDAGDGIVFLDEIAELSLAAQAMLLRTLSEGEVVRVGENRPRRVRARVVAATASDLPAMVASGTFRADLFFRLRFLRLCIPAVRARGDDWRLLTSHYLDALNRRNSAEKSWSADATRALAEYSWPGNVRELKSVVELGFYSAPGHVIDTDHVAAGLEPVGATRALEPVLEAVQPVRAPSIGVYTQLVVEKRSFWDAVHAPFMNRELSRSEVSALVQRGLREAGGSYKDLLTLFGVAPADYLKFMDFLRHHRLKQSRRDRLPAGAAAAR